MLDTIWQCRTQWQVESPKSEPTWMRRQKLVKWATRTFPSVAPRSRVWWSSCWTRWNELNRNQTTSPINRSGIRVAVVAWTRERLIWWMSWSNSFVSPILSKLQVLSKTETNTKTMNNFLVFSFVKFTEYRRYCIAFLVCDTVWRTVTTLLCFSIKLSNLPVLTCQAKLA